MEIFEVTALTEADLVGLRPKTVQQVRALHHEVARAYASGMKKTDIARMVGRSPPTITNILDTPATQELVAAYAEDNAESCRTRLELHRELATKAAVLAMAKIVDDLENDVEMSHRTLLAIADSGGDRSGFGRVETKINFNASIGSALDKAAKRLKAMRTAIAPQSPVVELPKQSDGTFGKVLGLERRI